MYVDAAILAGGNSSRFGSFKQVEPITRKRETLLEVNIQTAVACGARRAVVVTNVQLEPVFRALLSKWNGKVEWSIVVQSTNLLPAGTSSGVNRTKPWGIAHALWTATRELGGKFIVMNADDHYSPAAVQKLYDVLVAENNPDHHYMAAYRLRNTLFDGCRNVNRGVCAEDGVHVRHIDVAHSISRSGGNIHGVLKQCEQDFSGTETTCMNLYGFCEGIYLPLEDHIRAEVESISDNTREVTIHEMLNTLIGQDRICLESVHVDDYCLGLTNTEDKLLLQKHLAENYGL